MNTPPAKRKASTGEMQEEIKKKARVDVFKRICLTFGEASDLLQQYPDFYSYGSDMLDLFLMESAYNPYRDLVRMQEKREREALRLRANEDREALRQRAKEWRRDVADRIAREEADPAFKTAVTALERTLSGAFGDRAPCILSCLPKEFIQTPGQSSATDLKLSMTRMLTENQAYFAEFGTVEDFLQRLGEAIPSVLMHSELQPTVSTGLLYNATTSLLTIQTARDSEFHPSKTLLMRDSYWDILRELQLISAAVVIGDPGIGKSSLLRVVYELFVNKGSPDLEKVVKDRFATFQGVFWIMESGQFHYASKTSSASVIQSEGVYGSGHEMQDVWRRDDVLLLVDGAVASPFLAKIKNVFVFASPQPANYRRMMKATNAVRLTLPPWSEAEVEQLLTVCKADVRERMKPYIAYLQRKIGDDDDKSEHDPEGEKSAEEDAPYAVADDVSTSHSVGQDSCSSNVDMEDADDQPEAPEASSASSTLAGHAHEVWNYDDVKAFEDELQRADSADEWPFLHAHIMWRYQLVGGRIRLLLNPSETSATLKKQVRSAIHAVSIDDLQDQSSIDSHRYVPSVMYSLVLSSNDARDPPDAQFASTTISCLVLARLARAKSQSVVTFLAADGGGTIFGSILGHMFESFVHDNLRKRQTVWMKYLQPPVDGAVLVPPPRDWSTSKTDVQLAALKEVKEVIFPVESRKTKTAGEVKPAAKGLTIVADTYYKPTRANQPQVDSLVLYSSPLVLGSHDLPRLMLFQMTVSSRHSFIPNHIIKLTKQLAAHEKKDWLQNYAFVFVVSRKHFDKFEYQARLTEKRKPMKATTGKNIPQFALAFRDADMLTHLGQCVESVVKELRETDVVCGPGEVDPPATAESKQRE